MEREFEVTNSLGVHARVAAKIVEAVGGLDCRLVLVKDDIEAEGDSVLSILTLDAPQGTRILARAAGPQADEALAALSRVLSKETEEL